MLERGLVSWLVTSHLSSLLDSVRLYGLEYSTALLMNLCLHRAGKEQCVPLASSVLNLLLRLLVRDLKPVNIRATLTRPHPHPSSSSYVLTHPHPSSPVLTRPHSNVSVLALISPHPSSPSCVLSRPHWSSPVLTYPHPSSLEHVLTRPHPRLTLT